MGVIENIVVTAAASVRVQVDLCQTPSGYVTGQAVRLASQPLSYSSASGLLYRNGQTVNDVLISPNEQLECVTTVSRGTAVDVYMAPAGNIDLSIQTIGSFVRVDIPFGATYDQNQPESCSNPKLYQYAVYNVVGTQTNNIVGGTIRMAFRPAVSPPVTSATASLSVCGVTVTNRRVSR